jgi:hypothetical protein
VDPTTMSMAAPKVQTQAGAAEHGVHLKLDIQALDHSGSEQFRSALERHTGVAAAGKPASANSLGNVIAGRTTDLASEVKKDQQYVSKLLETATRSGDKIHLMRAMMALSDYQLRVQMISKTVSKAATSIDSLTKLQ